MLLLTHPESIKERERDRKKGERDREKKCVINTLGCVNNIIFKNDIYKVFVGDNEIYYSRIPSY